MRKPLTRSLNRRYLLFLLAVAGLTLFSPHARAQVPPAGQIITSRSQAFYERSGSLFSVFSNEVSVSVLPVHRPLVTPDGTVDAPAAAALAFSGERVAFPFVLRNAGNETDDFTLEIVYPAPSDFVPAVAAVYLDADRDSVVDPGEVVVSAAGDLAPGEEVYLVVEAVLPSGLAAGAIAHLDLVARSAADPAAADDGNVVRIVARADAQVALALEADAASVLPGDTVGFTVRFANNGERTATAIALASWIDLAGMCEGTEFAAGSASSSVAGVFEYYDAASSAWSAVQPPADRVKGIRLLLAGLAPGAGGDFSFRVRVRDDRAEGNLRNVASSDYTDGEAAPRSLVSNEVLVSVGRVSAVAIGPRGDPTAAAGSPADCVVTVLGGSASSYVLWHEILNGGNFADSIRVALVDSAAVPGEWEIDFVDSTGAPLASDAGYRAIVGTVPRGGSCVVGIRLQATPEGFRRFAGRQIAFAVEAASLFFAESSDRVDNVLVKADIPIISITQSIREPAALVGDILSFIATVENVTAETVLDTVTVVERLSPGLGFAGGSIAPRLAGNTLTWNAGPLAPGEKRDIVFRARVKAGQETGRLVSSAWAHGVTDAGERVSDGPAQAAVLIVEGIFTRRGIIAGAVFADTDGDGARDGDERGVRGASVFIEDGTYAVTDSLGLYSIPGVVEGRHVVRIDPASLPDSLVPGGTGYFGLGEAGEHLVDLAPSGNRRADFPLARAAAAAAGDGVQTSVDGAGTGFPESDGTADSAAASPAGSFDAITIPSAHFKAGSANIEGIPLSRVAALALWIAERPDWRILVEGHTDSIPIRSADFPSNLELSIARARSVYQILRMNGISEERMDYTGHGARMPVASNATEEGRDLNRRVEIRIVPPDGYSAGDPGLPALFAETESTETKKYSLADSAGVCADIILPAEGTVFFSRGEIDIDVVSPLGSDVELYVNNVPVGKERIGLKRIDIANGTFGSTFYGVKIEEGRNDILVVCREYGGKRSTCVRRVYLAGQPRVITPEHETVAAPADGKTSPELVFLVSDANGLPVRDGVFVTVEGPEDLVGRLDANPQQTGVQAATAGGRVVLALPPSRESRRETVRVSLGDIAAACRVDFESALRQWFLFGYGEGELGYSDLSGSGSTHRSLERHHDGAYAEGKLSFYGQGEIGSGHLLTAAVDTRPVRDDMLFRRIEPEKYYPIYGDASELRFNTASRSGTFVRLDHRRYGAMFGDFQTDFGKTEFTKYHRSFNGASGEARFRGGNARAFVTRTDQSTYQEEIRAEGTAGFYFLEHYPLVEGSEKIRVEVRDRYRPERIVRVDAKQVNRDYDINYMDGSILFKESVPGFDESLNPVTIVVSYECRNGGERNFIYGARSSIAVVDSLAFGTTVVVEEEGEESSTLFGVDLSGRLREGLRLESEYARSEKFTFGDGDAFRFLLTGERTGAVGWNVYYRDIDESFFNSSFTGGKTELGSRKFGGELDWNVKPGFGVSAKGYRHSLRERDETKDYADLLCRYSAGALEWRAGLAGAGHSDTREGDHAALLLLTGLALHGASVQGELQWDQIITGEEVQEYPNRLQAKLSRRLWKSVAAVLKHEYRTGSRTGTRHLTQLGLESNITESMTAYSRYQLEGAASGERGQATMGIKNRFALSEDLTATVAAEKLATVSGEGTEDYFTLSTGALYTPKEKDYRLKGAYEVRLERARRKHLTELAALKRLGGGVSVLVKGDLWFSDEKYEANHVKGSATVGFSLRPKSAERLTVFSLFNTEYEKNSPAHPGAVDRELLSSVEANYAASAEWQLEGKLAARWVSNVFRAYAADASAFMYQAHVVRTVANRWDVGVKARVVYQRETATTSYGGGVEIGRVVAGNVWCGAGYDFGGHEDPDASVNGFTRNGFHVGMRLKFNEKIMSCFHGGREDGE